MIKQLINTLLIFAIIILFFILLFTYAQDEFSPTIYPVGIAIYSLIIFIISPRIFFSIKKIKKTKSTGLFIIVIAILSLIIFTTSTIFLYNRGLYSEQSNNYALRITYGYIITMGLLYLIFYDRGQK